MHSPYPTFSTIVLMDTIYNFSNFSDDSNLYALRTCIIFGKGLWIRGKKNSANFAVKIVRKALKWQLQHLHFQKLSREHVPRSP